MSAQTDIAADLTRIIGAKSDLKTSIEGKGVTVPAATKIDGYAALVDQIQTGGGGSSDAVLYTAQTLTTAQQTQARTNIAAVGYNVTGSGTPVTLGLEQTTNKVTSLSSSSTDTQYPSAKCVYDYIDDTVGDIATLLAAI